MLTQVPSITARRDALATLHAAMASAALHRRRSSTALHVGSGVDACRKQRDELQTALAAVVAVPRPLAPDIAEPVHLALRLLDELRWVDAAQNG